jgi:hypothetical protein
MPLNMYGMLLTASHHFGQHAKCCLVASKYSKIMQAAKAPCCMGPILLADSAAFHMPEIYFL